VDGRRTVAGELKQTGQRLLTTHAPHTSGTSVLYRDTGIHRCVVMDFEDWEQGTQELMRCWLGCGTPLQCGQIHPVNFFFRPLAQSRFLTRGKPLVAQKL